MSRGIDAAAAGMTGVTYLNDIIANNLANINTAGFKQTLVSFKNAQDLDIAKIDAEKGYQNTFLGKLSAGGVLDATVLDYKQGTLKSTGNPLDLAISGDGFFVVQTPDGLAYTRNGSFVLGQNSILTTQEGYPVIGDKGRPIKANINNIDPKSIRITADGSVEINKEIMDKIKIVDFADKKNMQLLGNSLLKPVGTQVPVKSKNFQIEQGSIESSNANTIECMIKSMEGSRIYETLTKTIETSHKTLGKAVNEVGRIKR